MGAGLKIRAILHGLIVGLLVSACFADFKSEQLRCPRVRAAYEEKSAVVQGYFTAQEIDYPSEEIFLRVFKLEREVELWARDEVSDKFTLVRTYAIAYLSGELGPKRRRGDLQVPEGIYHISGFNPASSFHLSLRIDYPNESDRILGYKPDLGGDIFIHGRDVSIGCVPITDECIKELYIIIVDAKNRGQNKIPVHIFPFRFDHWQPGDKVSDELKTFWDNLESVYSYFEERKTLPGVNVDSAGIYLLE